MGQQYDKVSRVGGNFSFDIDTFVIIIIRCITLGVVCSSIFPSRLNLVYSTPWNSHVCGPAPNSTSGSSLRGVVTRFFVYSSNCHSFLGGLTISAQGLSPPPRAAYLPAPPPHLRWPTRATLLPDQASHDYNLNFKLSAISAQGRVS